MHLPDGALNAPTIAITTVLAAAGLGYSVHRLRARMGERTTVLTGTTAAFIFAAQMVNFPLFPLPISGHLMGGTLAAVLLGPWAGACALALVLLVQCLLFGDGGLSALGANFLNMGMIGSLCGYAIYAPIRRRISGPGGTVIAAMLAAWFSVLLASGAVAIELGLSEHRTQLLSILGWMVLVHAAIGVGEAIITGSVLGFILRTRPDLIAEVAAPSRPIRWAQVAGAGLLIALAVAIVAAPFASEHADGLEYVGGRLQVIPEDAPAIVDAKIPDYEMPGLDGLPKAAVAAAGVAGTLIVFAVATAFSIGLSRQQPTTKDPKPHAA